MNKQKGVLFNSHLELSGFSEARFLYLTQGDKTPLNFELKDKNNEVIALPQTEGEAQIVDSETNEVKALETCTVVDGKAEFVLSAANKSEVDVYDVRSEEFKTLLASSEWTKEEYAGVEEVFEE